MNIMNVLYQVLVKLYKVVTWQPGPTAAIGAVVTLGFAIFQIGQTLWLELFSRMDHLTATTLGQVDFSPLAFANYCLPLDDFLTLLSGWAVLFVVAAGVRIIKSFIPTIA